MKLNIRIGHGFDVHAFAENRRLVLGGVDIPHTMGLLGHSDADVLIHALCDALLGAAGMGDIGRHFPDSDVQYKDADSALLLAHVVKLLEAAGWGIGNVDITVMAQVPKLAPFVADMRVRLAELLLVDQGEVNIKATTTEKLGFVGRKEGIACEAVALISRL
ncbi:2-C-methyl-D-erythritol 2,4-cyclodiphosphate synthase [Mariprofundus aestuarium]|uniref:2-C-methyl-D-erythritol 2,4-cyclodiphosphate synthase n=1 Tax=Mariprofundus aestuarium TaxID=1921086 RepID=A0A2K8KW76_MARES|nr:2-C-methyl-D-erythritol 2,4-cyclodiphosphate synthase [Mariprofundus aestuarium]ATX79053.1 2-C-methyl-D-erythritol 2,4-cyclodiphosphate synthase [Mariprofundus aestuarium]